MRYDLFISYSHAADGRLAPAVQKGLRKLACPWNRRQALRVFRDDTGLSVTPALWPAIEDALRGSNYFLFLASPESAHSEWVAREIQSWITHGSAERLLVALTDGEWVWDSSRGDLDFERSTAAPPALRGVFREEPRHLDLRWARTETSVDLRNTRFRDAVADLAAPVHGKPKDELEGEDIRQHRRAARLRRIAVAGLATLAVATTVGGVLAVLSRQEAVRQRNLAEERARIATSRAVAATAVNLVPDRHELALLLAAESVGIAETDQARESLIHVLASQPRLLGYLGGQRSSVLSLAFSPDQALLAGGAADGLVLVWDLDSRAEVIRMQGPASGVHALRFTPDSKQLVSVGGNGSVWRWKVGTSTPDKVFSYDGGKVQSVGLDPDAAFAALAIENGSILVVDVRRGGRHAVVRGALHAGALALGSNLELAASDPRNALGIWKLSGTTQTPVESTSGSSYDLTSVAFSSEGQSVAVAAVNGDLITWERSRARRSVLMQGTVDDQMAGATALPMTLAVTWAKTDEHSEYLVSSNDRGEIIVWESDSETVRITAGHADIGSLAFGAGTGILASGSADGTVALWDLAGRTPCFQVSRNTPNARTAARSLGCVLAPGPSGGHSFAGDGRFLIASEGVWDVVKGTSIATTTGCMKQELRPFGVFAAALGPGARRLACTRSHFLNPPTGGYTEDILIRDLTGSAPDLTLPDHSYRLAFLDDATLAYVTEDKNVLRLRNADTGRERSIAGWSGSTLEGLCGGFAFTPDGQTLVWGIKRGVHVWPRNQPKSRIVTGDACPSRFAFDPKRPMFAASVGSSISLWDLHTGTRIATASGHAQEVTGLAYSPDGEILASCSSDGSVRLWYAANGRPFGVPLMRHQGSVTALAFVVIDGSTFLVTSGEMDTVVWEYGFSAWRRRTCALASRALSPEEFNDLVGAGIPRGNPCAETPEVSSGPRSDR